MRDVDNNDMKINGNLHPIIFFSLLRIFFLFFLVRIEKKNGNAEPQLMVVYFSFGDELKAQRKEEESFFITAKVTI